MRVQDDALRNKLLAVADPGAFEMPCHAKNTSPGISFYKWFPYISPLFLPNNCVDGLVNSNSVVEFYYTTEATYEHKTRSI